MPLTLPASSAPRQWQTGGLAQYAPTAALTETMVDVPPSALHHTAYIRLRTLPSSTLWHLRIEPLAGQLNASEMTQIHVGVSAPVICWLLCRTYNPGILMSSFQHRQSSGYQSHRNMPYPAPNNCMVSLILLSTSDVHARAPEHRRMSMERSTPSLS